MMGRRCWIPLLPLILISTLSSSAGAAKVIGVGVLDRDYLVVHVLDGEVEHETSTGERITRYAPELNTTAAAEPGNWTITSSQDANYGGAGQHPTSCYRKKKLSGHAQMEWVDSDYRYEYTYQHWIYLQLPSSLQQGSAYTLDIAGATNTTPSSAPFTFDVYTTRSEAVHVNLVGYAPDASHKAADLYHWMGDGGARDYTSFVGNKVYLYDVTRSQASEVGGVAFWKASGGDVFGYNLTRSSVWAADFSSFTTPGTYRLVVEGVGCSQDFEIAPAVYASPYQVSLRGFFYMRIGQDNPAGFTPPPRTPLYIPDTSPADTKVYLTEMQPWHAEWNSFVGGDKWDSPNAWASFRKAGNPTNPNAWGGHADAADWDRHLAHVSIIYDMLLPYLLTGGAIKDDDTGIAESGNGIPDVLDEARYEVDFWLRLRDGSGYSHGLTNPNDNHELFQAGATAVAAWANSANAAMLADAFRIAGATSLMDQYRAAAVEAYHYADGLTDPMLDEEIDLGNGAIRGRDLKMMAAACLYNVTGDQTWEAVVESESVCTSATAEINNDHTNQIWATAAYLMTPQTVHFATLREYMKASIINEAKTKETDQISTRPSRRATDDAPAYFRTSQNVQRTMIAHAVTGDATEKALFRKALALEADWGLGRNPLNVIEMTTWHTPLATKRSVEYIYTAGRDDGVTGVFPGHTPYLNLDDWDSGMVMGRPSALYAGTYPSNFVGTWPIGEAYFDTPWVWAHSEFTPQQTMRGKMALYGYLYGIDHDRSSGDGGAGGAGATGGGGTAGGGPTTAGTGAVAGGRVGGGGTTAGVGPTGSGGTAASAGSAVGGVTSAGGTSTAGVPPNSGGGTTLGGVTSAGGTSTAGSPPTDGGSTSAGGSATGGGTATSGSHAGGASAGGGPRQPIAGAMNSAGTATAARAGASATPTSGGGMTAGNAARTASGDSGCGCAVSHGWSGRDTVWLLLSALLCAGSRRRSSSAARRPRPFVC